MSFALTVFCRPSSDLSVFVKRLKKTISLQVESSDRVISAKVIIQAKEEIPMDQQVKIFLEKFCSSKKLAEHVFKSFDLKIGKKHLSIVCCRKISLYFKRSVPVYDRSYHFGRFIQANKSETTSWLIYNCSIQINCN